MRIALGSDHRGFDMKQAIISLLDRMKYEYHDFGSYDKESVDYPDFAIRVSREVGSKHFDYGILICGTGIGMCIVANKIKGVRAASCHDVFEAQRARQHNDANVLCLGGDNTDINLALDITRTFLTTEFEGGRHQRRVDKINSLDSERI